MKSLTYKMPFFFALTVVLYSIFPRVFSQEINNAVTLINLQAMAACPTQPVGTVPLHRLRLDNPLAANHFYTSKESDRISAISQGYRYEGVAGMLFPSQVVGTVPLYRLYSIPGTDHFYTVKDLHRQQAIKAGYRDEGIEGYVYPTNVASECWTTPFYRLFAGGLITDHFYTTDSVERFNAFTQNGYVDEGIEGYLIKGSNMITVPRRPVMIVGGTLAAEIIYWSLEARLKRDGFTYKFFELPEHGTIDINQSAAILKESIDIFLQKTGASKINLIGHSQGSTVARTYIHRFNGENTVESMISLAGPNKGTEAVDSWLAKFLGCPGPLPCSQLAVNSTLIQEINGEAHADIIYYTNFTTDNDILVTPVQNGRMDACDRTSPFGTLACNVHVQNECPNRIFLEHIGMASDAAVYSGIRQALLKEPISLNCDAL